MDGQFRRPGVNPPEYVGAQDGALEIVLRELAARGVRCRAKTASFVPQTEDAGELLAVGWGAGGMATTYVNARPEIPVESLTLPAGFYTDPEVFRREMEAVHFDMWLYGGRTEELPAAGSYVVRKVGHANILVVRGEDARIRAFHNVCR